MTTETPFNADLATTRWVNRFKASSPITDQDLFEMTRDILQIHAGENWHSGQVRLAEEETPRDLLVRYISSDDPCFENIYVVVVQEDRSLEEIIFHKEKGGERFSTWWKETVPISSPILGYDVTDAEVLVQPSLKPEQTLKLAKTIWDAHTHTLVEYGKTGLLALPIITGGDIPLSAN